jgi:ABC-2 type transport system permease protein
MPITPLEIMLGKIIPYVLVGFAQAALIVGIGVALFGVRSSAASRCSRS